MTTLIYAFENIDPTNLTCFQTIKASDTSEENPSGGDGAGDAWADYRFPQETIAQSFHEQYRQITRQANGR